MKFLILLVLLTFAVAEIYQIPLRRSESPMIKMMKAGTWNDYIAKKDVIRSIAHKINRKYTQNVTDYENVEYVANITIGTPGQWFTVLLDTTSSYLWVPDATCEDVIGLQYGPRSKSDNKGNAEHVSLVGNGCEGKNKFNSNESATYVFKGAKWKFHHNSGLKTWYVEGFLGEDTVRFGESEIGSLTVSNVTFGQATFISPQLSRSSFDGILGLAYPALNPQNIASALFKAIKQKLVDPLFSVYLVRKSSEHIGHGGTFTYGGLDDVNCGPVIAYQALTSASYYKFFMKSVNYGSYSSKTEWDTILDTTTAFIGAPYDVIKNLAQVAKAYYSVSDNCYVVDCAAQLGDIQLGIGAKTYDIGRNEYIHQKESGKCCMAIYYDGGTGFRPQWILGYPFLRSYCTIYEIKRKRVGFALPKTK